MSRIFLAIASLALAACSSTGPAFARFENPPALAARRIEVRLTDERPLEKTAIDVPMVTLPGGGQELSPALEPELQASLERTLRMHVLPAARSLRIEVHVLEGRASWHGNLMSESEKGSARVSVSVFDTEGDRLLVTGTGESWAERTSFDTNEKRVLQILGLAVQAAVFEFLASPDARAALAVST